MPAPLSIALLGFGGILTAVDATAGVAVGAVGVLIEFFLFFSDGRG